MCGIAGFLSNPDWHKKQDLSWLDHIIDACERSIASEKWEDLSRPIQELIGRFDQLMCFDLHMALVDDPETLAKVDRLSHILAHLTERIATVIAEHGRTDLLELLAEDSRDCHWQLEQEVLGNVHRTTRLLPLTLSASDATRSRHFLAWSIELVMENLDRLEVRGRDSAGISIQCVLPASTAPPVPPESGSSLRCYPGEKGENTVERQMHLGQSADGAPVYTFVHKVANLVGRLGDNTAALRESIRDDPFLWEIGATIESISIAAHTRWASNGIISLPNCHPANGALHGTDHDQSRLDVDVQFVLNGDVDNYPLLMSEQLGQKGYGIDPAITTDAKILPVYYRLGTDCSQPPEDRFAHLMNACEGSLAIVMQHPRHPRALFLSQKGSGQSLFVGRVIDGFILASEVYGLAARTRRSYALIGTERGGTQLTLSAETAAADTMVGRYLEDLQPFEIVSEPIYIHSRDIFRGSYDYYFEKEINEAPSSVRKTIKGKYRKSGGKIDFDLDGKGVFHTLLGRLRDPDQPPIRRIMCIGQGTAAVAAMGTAHLIHRALARSRITVGWSKASEMSGFLANEPLSDMLVIAISQSGTTTDTNRTVDVAGMLGAWIHAIVNRRNSPLVSKSDSHLYTSDGRDVEMAVASTKAFYSQIAAGKLTALVLARELECLTDDEIYQEITDLEGLPAAIEAVLSLNRLIRESAEKLGPSSRNWAVVGNGPNKIAADEIRIKLSELCYKSIPCDFTEDKKHIDLSTEPLTIVIANDLPEQIVQDTAKEVAIFKAHNGKPLVMCSQGEKRFHPYSEMLIELPIIGGGLGFVLATVAGHLWGFYAAKAVDAGVEDIRKLRAMLADALDNPSAWNASAVKSKFTEVLEPIARGEMNAALPASTAASLALYRARLDGDVSTPTDLRDEVEKGIALLNKAVEEMTRPIDTIRHQAKTVTVGISRPQEMLPPILLAAFEELSVAATQIKEQDRRALRAVAPVISEVAGGLLYRLVRPSGSTPGSRPGDPPWIQVTQRFGFCEGKTSRYDKPRPAGGSKRTALRLERAVWTAGPGGDESLVIVPLIDETGGESPGILLFHLVFASRASVQQKLGIIRGLGNRYHEFVERLEEVSDSRNLEDALERVPPRDLILAPIERLAVPVTHPGGADRPRI
ncbi:MAG: SIS domain-containing protein [Desulfomonile tiedjei]|nr:SIS domain-containing protein [Desulfomonile tiedjei]